jgi:3-phenylpropionate/cinnamic acid dioxygenase small subunit
LCYLQRKDSIVTDEESIRQTLARFGRLLDERRFEAWSELFCEDGGFGTTAGRSEILSRMLTGELATMSDLFRKHATVNITIEVDGDRATAESDLLLFERRAGLPWDMRFGRYTDRLRRVDDSWLIEHRQLTWTANPIDDGNPVDGV